MKIHKNQKAIESELDGIGLMGARYGKDGWLVFLVHHDSKKETWSVSFDPTEVEFIARALKHKLNVNVGSKVPSLEDFSS